jgi:transcription antitermination factor NusG
VEKKWFVFYTKSRQEKKVNDLLVKNGFVPYLPLQTSMRQWSDRKKKVVTPLFNSYIFVQISEHEIPKVLTIPGVAWTIRHNGKPAVIREEEVELIKRFLSTGLFIETASASMSSFKSGDRAKIVDGPLAGLVGMVTNDGKGEKFMVQIESIQHVMRVQIPGYLLEKA